MSTARTNKANGMKKNPKPSEAVLRVELALESGQRREWVRKKYAHLSTKEIYEEWHRVTMEAPQLLALYWERTDSHPTGN